MKPSAVAGLVVCTSALLVPAEAASGREPFPRQRFSAYATGTAVHAGVLRAAVGGARLVDAGVAVSAASTDSDGLGGTIVDEMEQAVQPAGPAGTNTYARGTGVEATLAAETPLETALGLAGVAEAAAPPATALVNEELGPVAVDGVVSASLAGGQAQPVWSERTCVIGQPTSFGRGYAADVGLLDLLTSPRGPIEATTSQSRSLTYLAPNPDGTFALVSESRVTVAPLTLFEGSANEMTIELLGEWMLRAVATGKRDGARVDYGPADEPGPATPVVRLVQAGGVSELTLQQILGTRGLSLPVHPLVAIAVGEHPRPIAAPGRTVDPADPPEESSDGTRAAAAVDVVRVTVLQPAPAAAPRLLELRLGHMEVRSTVPPGGARCHIPIRKTGNRDFVNPGEEFTWTISIPSTSDAFDGLSCDLVAVQAVDVAEASPGVRFTILSASREGMIDGETVTWADLGRYHPGDPPIVVTISGRVEPGGLAGTLTDTVDVTASLENCTGGAAGRDLLGLHQPVALRGSFTLEGPRALRATDLPASAVMPYWLPDERRSGAAVTPPSAGAQRAQDGTSARSHPPGTWLPPGDDSMLPAASGLSPILAVLAVSAFALRRML